MSRVRAVLGVCLCVLTLVACAPSAPDHDEWRGKGDQAMADVASNVATARLLLQQLRAGKVFGEYAQTTVLDTETNAESAASRFAALQPPSADDDAYRRVGTVLSDAGDLLAQVRIAVVRRDGQAYPGLIRQLSSTLTDLSKEQARLGVGPPR